MSMDNGPTLTLSDHESTIATIGERQPPDSAVTSDLHRRAYGLFLRGMDIEVVADQLSVSEADVARWVAERAARGGQSADTLRLLKRRLFSSLDEADARAKPKYATALMAIESRLHQLDGRCGARTADPGFCDRLPLTDRSRCALHGGLTPTGRDSPHFIHGRDSKYAVPLAEEEQARYEAYKRGLFDPAREDLADDLAIARIQRDRAIAAGGSGVAEAGVIARLALTHGQITSGRTIRVLPDEGALKRLADGLASVVSRHVTEAQFIEVARDLGARDWSAVASGTETVCAEVTTAAEPLSNVVSLPTATQAITSSADRS